MWAGGSREMVGHLACIEGWEETRWPLLFHQRKHQESNSSQDDCYYDVIENGHSGDGYDVVDDEDVGCVSLQTSSLFTETFLHNSRLEQVMQVMAYHPQYMKTFLETQQFLMRGDGPLPLDYRHYIAIMAAGRHQCAYLIGIQSEEFLLCGGKERWLHGLSHIPNKLKNLYELNKIMAHRPWLLSKDHIERLKQGEDNWSLSELMHALAILAHYHALSSFVYACGIAPEIDQPGGHTYQPLPGNGPAAANAGDSAVEALELEGGIEVLMERMRKLNEAPSAMSQEELLKRFETVESQSAELSPDARLPVACMDVLHFVEDPDFTYEDFAKRGNPSTVPTFRAQDFSWDEQGFSLANRLYPDIGTYLDDKFRITKNLTYYTMGDNRDVDTFAFRRAIWNYIHCVFGIRHDDYDYSQVNQLLERSLKAFIKTLACFPSRVTKTHYQSFMHEFKNSEKIHVNLMLLEARLQAELLYTLRAINSYLT